ncbi:hypothetical protein C0992_007324, partial [Termitomyces sp. T32_za158]
MANSRLFSRRRISHNVLAAPVIPEDEHGKEDILSEAQAAWNDTFYKSLCDFQHTFEEEEIVRSVGERERVNKFDRTMTNFHDNFLRNHRRRQKLYEKADALQEKIFQKADAAREAIFVQGQQDRAHAYKIEEELRGKQVESYSTARKGLFSDGRQKLTQRYDALNAALVEQFDRLMEKQKEMDKVAEKQSNHQDAPILVPPDGSSGSVNSQSVTSLLPSSKSSTSPSSSHAENLDSTSQPTSIEYNDQQDVKIFQPPSPSVRSRSWVSSSPHPESLTPCTHPMSAETSDQQKESVHLIEQGNREESTQSDGVEDKPQSDFMRSQNQQLKTFLQTENERNDRFRELERVRDIGERRRRHEFDRKMSQWSRKPQIEQIRGREEERFRRDNQRSFAFHTAEYHRWTALEMSMTAIICQADVEDELEEIHFERQEDMLLALYKRQAIQLDQQISDQIILFKLRREPQEKPCLRLK